MMSINFALKVGDIRNLPKPSVYIKRYKQEFIPLITEILKNTLKFPDDTLIDFSTWGWEPTCLEGKLQRFHPKDIKHEDEITKRIKKYKGFEYINDQEFVKKWLPHPWPKH